MPECLDLGASYRVTLRAAFHLSSGHHAQRTGRSHHLKIGTVAGLESVFALGLALDKIAQLNTAHGHGSRGGNGFLFDEKFGCSIHLCGTHVCRGLRLNVMQQTLLLWGGKRFLRGSAPAA